MKAICLIAACLLLAGCGTGDEQPANSAEKPTIRNGAPDRWTEQQVIDALKLRYQPTELTASGEMVPTRPARPDDIGMATASDCSVSVIMTSASAVDLYAGAGDTVVTNPAGDAGVKTSNDQACLAELERGLSTLK